MDLKKTPLNQWHKDNGARMVEYAGWEMPVQYSEGLVEEHLFTRSHASLFDVSHMGEFKLSGPQAFEFLDYLSPSKLENLKGGEAAYSFFPNEKGGVVDDLIIYKFFNEDEYLVCVNASNTQKVEEHINKYKSDFDVEVVNESAAWGQIALQGPKAMEITNQVFNGALDLQRFTFKDFNFLDQKLWIARTGYTGEDGVEIFIPQKLSVELWQKFIELGAKPCGLGARDTLRMEAALNLYGHEIDEDCNPFERRMGWTVDFSKSKFLAKDQLINLKEKTTRTLTGLKLIERGIPRQGYPVILDGAEVGIVTSGTMSPSLKEPVAMVWIDKAATQGKKDLKVQIRSREIAAEICKLPFVKNI